MPVKTGIQNLLKSLDSRTRDLQVIRGNDKKRQKRLFTRPSKVTVCECLQQVLLPEMSFF